MNNITSGWFKYSLNGVDQMELWSLAILCLISLKDSKLSKTLSSNTILNSCSKDVISAVVSNESRFCSSNPLCQSTYNKLSKMLNWCMQCSIRVTISESSRKVSAFLGFPLFGMWSISLYGFQKMGSPSNLWTHEISQLIMKLTFFRYGQGL